MNSLNSIRSAYLTEGLDYLNASTRTCQDVFLKMVASSPLSRNVTFKGGVVMQHISKDCRRATQDIDLDFIKYSLNRENDWQSLYSRLRQVLSDKRFVDNLIHSKKDWISAPVDEVSQSILAFFAQCHNNA